MLFIRQFILSISSLLLLFLEGISGLNSKVGMNFTGNLNQFLTLNYILKFLQILLIFTNITVNVFKIRGVDNVAESNSLLCVREEIPRSAIGVKII